MTIHSPFHASRRISWLAFLGSALVIVMLAAVVITLPARPGLAAPNKCARLPFVDDTLSKKERVDALMEQGATCLKEGNLTQVIATFSEVIGLDPDNVDAYINRGGAYVRRGLIELGLADYSHVIRKDPSLMRAWYNRGTTFLAVKQYDAAIADLTETIRLQPDFARAYCNRGLARIRKSDYEGASEDLETGLKLDSKMVVCYYARGEIRFKSGEFEQAVDDLTKGLALAPAPQAFESRAKAYEQLGEEDKALADYEAALKLVPNYESAKEGIKRLQESKDKP